MSQGIEQNDEVSSSFQAHFLMPLLAAENASLSGGAQAPSLWRQELIFSVQIPLPCLIV